MVATEERKELDQELRFQFLVLPFLRICDQYQVKQIFHQ